MTTRIYGTGQNVDYVEHMTLPSHTLRLHIHVDSHAVQAWGRVERWDGTQWREVATLAGEELQIDLKLGYQRQTRVQRHMAFQNDREQLLTLAKEVL